MTPARKRFDALVRRLERYRLELLAWREALPRWEQRYHEQVEPLLQARDAAQAHMVHALDAAHAAHKLSKSDRATLSDTICELAGALIEEGGFEQLKPIYDRHSEVGFDQEIAESNALLKSVIGAEFGLAPEELEHIQSPEELYAQVQQRLHEQQAHEAERAQKTAKSRRAGTRKAQKTGFDPQQSLRELYRKLVTALHPDRESDPQQRERKTALMQRLNSAYRDGDLLALLELQLEIGQLDRAGIAAMSEERIQHYNRMLATQLKEVEQELAQVAAVFMDRYDVYAERRPKPQRLDPLMAQIKRQLQHEIEGFAEELRYLQQASTLKQWLKLQRARIAEQERDAALMDFAFSAERW
ncbi:J domain-containing protein [Xanthomonas graminis]